MRARLLAPALAGSALLAYFAAELYVLGRPGFPLDDSWIHLHFASRLDAGDGLAYNPGVRVPGSSSPLWTALLAPAFLVAAPLAILWSKLLGAVFLVATVLATERLGALLGLGRRLRIVAAAMVATSHWLLWAALSGMEVTLFTALSLWGLVFHLREKRLHLRNQDRLRDKHLRDEHRPGSTGLSLIAVACLARPEGLLLLMLALLDRINDGRRSEARELTSHMLTPLIASALLLVPIALFYFSLSGSPAPSTLAAKTRPDLLPSGAYLRLVLDVFWRSQPILTLLALGGVVASLVHGMAEQGSGRRAGGPLVASWLVTLPLAYSLLASPGWSMPLGNFGRYYFPLLPLVVIFGLLALEPLMRLPGPRLAGRNLPAGALVIAALLIPQVHLLASGPARYVQTVANVEDSDVRAALWLRERLPEEALLAVQDVGALKFFLPNSVIDLAGLISPEVVPILRRDDGVYWEKHLLEFLEQRRPDYLVVFSSSYPMLTSSPGFERMASFEVENNVTMAGDELVVLETPWCDQELTP